MVGNGFGDIAVTSTRSRMAAGAAAAAVGVGVTQFLAPFFSAAVDIGTAVMNLMPGPVKEWAVQMFGTSAEMVLWLVVLVLIAVLAAATGVWERSRVPLGTLFFLAAGATGCAAILAGPGARPADVVPTLSGAACAIAAIRLLTSGRITNQTAVADGVDPGRRLSLVTLGFAAAGVAGGVAGVSAKDAAARDAMDPDGQIFIDPTTAPYNVRFDRVTSINASMSASFNPTQLTVLDYTFTKSDIGKPVKVLGAATAGANLKTTIAGVAFGKAILASGCSTTVTNTFCVFGTDNATALGKLFDDLSDTNYPRKASRIAVLPAGAAMFSGTLIFPIFGTLKGASENFTLDLGMGSQGVFHRAENWGGSVFYQMWDQNADCARVRKFPWESPADWVGKLEGFCIIQDPDNTSGRGLSLRTATGTPVGIIDGGTINRVLVLGACEEGFEFNGCTGQVVLRDLAAWFCGYMDRRIFVGSTTAGDPTILNVSDLTGLAYGGILAGPGIDVDSLISSVDAESRTVTMDKAATATATDVSIQRSGSPGVRYTIRAAETVEFDGLAGDGNSGGLLRLEGDSSPYDRGAVVVLTNLKNEFTINYYRENSNVAIAPSIPQASNAVVLYGMRNSAVSIRGLLHWAGGPSNTDKNSLGRHIGAAIIAIPNMSPSAPDVTWEALKVTTATDSQVTTYAFRDTSGTTNLPIRCEPAGHHGGISKGTNRLQQPFRIVSDTDAIVSVHDRVIGWDSITSARKATLPRATEWTSGTWWTSVPPGTEIILIDMSGSASAENTITAWGRGTESVVGKNRIMTPYGQLRLISTGKQWVGVS